MGQGSRSQQDYLSLQSHSVDQPSESPREIPILSSRFGNAYEASASSGLVLAVTG